MFYFKQIALKHLKRQANVVNLFYIHKICEHCVFGVVWFRVKIENPISIWMRSH